MAETQAFLERIVAERARGNNRHASLDAWTAPSPYRERRNGIGADVPNFTIKVPTGGGKTLLATQLLGEVFRTVRRDANGAGLVLWVVPSSQIYNDTFRRLQDREDPYRLMLEHAVSRRVELWGKHNIANLSPAQLRDALNILVIQLASTNRETKDQLKFFRDSGGAIVRHFPPENDLPRHAELRALIPNLTLLGASDDATALVATSIANLVRIHQPVVVLDEGHKATSELARQTLEDFNASVILELSATPKKNANVVTRVSGQELLDEDMIKLPINILTSGEKSWQKILASAKDKREELARFALEHAHSSGDSRLIRPIVLVQVERTGRDQRDSEYIHSEDVKEYLLARLGVPESAIAVKTATRDDIEGIDLLAEGCSVQWIITKSALQEGWDCPYAYILVSLMNSKSQVGMTQLVGRILRQPFQARTPFAQLNQAYVYCLREQATDVAKQVKAALEREGYEEGDTASAVTSGPSGPHVEKRVVRVREEISDLYRDYGGQIYLPRFAVKLEAKEEPLDYYRHLVSGVDPRAFEYERIDWPIERLIAASMDRYYQLTLGTELQLLGESAAEANESDDNAKAWLTASLGFDLFGYRQLREIVDRCYDELCRKGVAGKLSLVKHEVRARLAAFVQEQLDVGTENKFRELFDAGSIVFHLECHTCRFELPMSFAVGASRPLTHHDGTPLRKALYEYVEFEDQNGYERGVALCLDSHADVLWWFRNCVGSDRFNVQGYRRQRIFPDFIVQAGSIERPEHRLVVLESKGKHLEGNPDTTYKRKIAEYFEAVGRQVPWQQLKGQNRNYMFRFEILDEAQAHGRTWQDELNDLLDDPPND